MANCKITIEITPTETIVDAKNWEGISNMTLEFAYRAVTRKFHMLKAQKLGLEHAKKMEAEAASRKEDKLKLDEELKNALQSKLSTAG